MPKGTTSLISNLPSVIVPVLSKATLSTLATLEKTLPPLKRIPRDAAPPIPPKNAIGTEITRAQGQDITRKVKAVYIELFKFLKPNIGGITATSNAIITTAGV